MADVQEALEGSGLTPIEAKVYLELLDLGSTTAGPIIKSLGLHRATVYAVLQRLIERGLASYVTRTGKRYFSATDPENIVEMLKEKEDGILSVMPQLKAKAELAKESENANVYEGSKGIKSILEGALRNSNKGDEYLVLGASDDVSMSSYLNNWLRRWTNEGNRLKMVFYEGSGERADLVSKLKGAEVKIAPKAYKSPVSIGILKDLAYIFLWSKKPLGFAINSSEVADSFKNYFNMIWNQDVKVYKGFDEAMGRFGSMLDTMKEGEEYYVLGASGGTEELKRWFSGYHKERVKRKIKVNMLFIPRVREQIFYEMTHSGDPEMKLAKVKELPPEFSSPMQINLYKGNRVLMFMFGKEMVCFEIESEILYKNFKNYFDILWNQEVRVTKGVDAVQELFEEILDAGSVDFIGARGYFIDARPKYNEEWEKRAIASGFKMRNIVDIGVKGHKITKFPFAETKYNIPKEFSKLGAFWIYGNKVAITNWVEKEPIVIHIENKLFYDMYKEQFELLWNQKSHVYAGQEGIEYCFNNLYETAKPEDELVVFAARPGDKAAADYNLKWNGMMSKKVSRVRLLYYGENESNRKRASDMNGVGCEARILSTEQKLPISTVVCGSTVLNIIWDPKPTVFKIENKTVADSTRANFDLLWKSAKK